MTDGEIENVITLEELLRTIGRNMAIYRKARGITQPEILVMVEEKSKKHHSRHIMSAMESGSIVDMIEDAAAVMGLEMVDFLTPPTDDYIQEAMDGPPLGSKSRSSLYRELQNREAIEKEMDEEIRTKDGYDTYVRDPVPEGAVLKVTGKIIDLAEKEGWKEWQKQRVLKSLFGKLTWRYDLKD